MSKDAILAIDQGTTSTRAIVFALDAQIIGSAQQAFAQHYPQDGWVEHDPEDIWQSTLSVCRQAMIQAESKGFAIVGIGITNQRETTLVWDRQSGKAIYNAIVWQDRRTAATCVELENTGANVTPVSGLRLDPYFSATKIAWILDNVEGARAQANKGELAFGTVDTFLLWRLTKGLTHATDTTNASRTNLFNINTLEWDDQLLALFNVPKTLLPKVMQSADDFGKTATNLFGKAIPICGIAGDQQAALIGQCCFEPGNLKSTYGTGCFALVNTGTTPLFSENKMLTTIGYSIRGKTCYALEGSIFIAGAAVQWLRDGIKVIDDAQHTQLLAEQVDDSHGTILVPAFAGLGAPHWDPYARGSIFGMTRGTSEAHLARAALESVCYQTIDLLSAMEQDGIQISAVQVDGGMVANDWFCDYLADILKLKVVRPKVMETTALGAAYLAGLQLGLYSSTDALSEKNPVDSTFTPSMNAHMRANLLKRWRAAVKSTLYFTRATSD